MDGAAEGQRGGALHGASDGGAHIEAMRTGGMRSGHCELRATGCQGFCRVLERHHESYEPERVIYLCHHCHHLVHFRPYHMTEPEKDRMLRVRHGPEKFLAFSQKPAVMRGLREHYIAPGRRPAQRKVRRELEERIVAARQRGRRA